MILLLLLPLVPTDEKALRYTASPTEDAETEGGVERGGRAGGGWEEGEKDVERRRRFAREREREREEDWAMRREGNGDVSRSLLDFAGESGDGCVGRGHYEGGNICGTRDRDFVVVETGGGVGERRLSWTSPSLLSSAESV